MPTLPPNVFKCRWCNFTIPKWRKSVDGKRNVSGWGGLMDHNKIEHEDAYDKMIEAFADLPKDEDDDE